jgi:ribulose kinase
VHDDDDPATGFRARCLKAVFLGDGAGCLAEAAWAGSCRGADERVVISGAAGRSNLVRQLLADQTGKAVLATRAEELVMLSVAMLGGVAGRLFDGLPSAMASMSRISGRCDPASGTVAACHEGRFRVFKQLQAVAREFC